MNILRFILPLFDCPRNGTFGLMSFFEYMYRFSVQIPNCFYVAPECHILKFSYLAPEINSFQKIPFLQDLIGSDFALLSEGPYLPFMLYHLATCRESYYYEDKSFVIGKTCCRSHSSNMGVGHVLHSFDSDRERVREREREGVHRLLRSWVSNEVGECEVVIIGRSVLL